MFRVPFVLSLVGPFGPRRAPLGTLSDPRRLPWGPFRTLLGFLKDPFGPSKALSGTHSALESSLGDPFGPIWAPGGRQRLPWEPFRTLEDSLRFPFGPFWTPLGRLWGSLGHPWGHFGRPWGVLGRPLGSLWAPWGPKELPKGTIFGSKMELKFEYEKVTQFVAKNVFFFTSRHRKTSIFLGVSFKITLCMCFGRSSFLERFL